MQTATNVKVPTNRQELNSLALQRDELVRQIDDLRGEQSRLIQQRHDATATNSTREVNDFTERIAEVGVRLRRLGQQKLAADDGITAALAAGVATQGETPAGIPGQTTEMPPPLPMDFRPPMDAESRASIIAGGLLGLSLIAFAFYRWGKRTARRLAGTPAAGGQDLKELRNAVDTIALEVERISENQRFVTALLSEKTPEQMAQLQARVEQHRGT